MGPLTEWEYRKQKRAEAGKFLETWTRWESLASEAVQISLVYKEESPAHWVEGWVVWWGGPVRGRIWVSDSEHPRSFETAELAKAAVDEYLKRLGYRLSGAAPDLLEVMMAVAPQFGKVTFKPSTDVEDVANKYASLVRCVAEALIAEAALPVGTLSEMWAEASKKKK